ncbi:uncharacterized protein [Rutidosis leptorrhynchoides]|uniref:uncharacterized protein n=1 Tax=Rutidosis leptorrhynchoides TaxID=125765 RepID=UPI003A9979C9
MNKLPVLVELDKRGVDLNSVLCPICGNEIETIEHVLIRCSVALDVWTRVSRWWNSNIRASIDVNSRFSGFSSSGSNTKSVLWQAIEWITGYILWKNRNNVIFKRKKGNAPMILNEIQVKAFDWISNRSKKHRLVWSQWLLNPNTFGDHG